MAGEASDDDRCHIEVGGMWPWTEHPLPRLPLFGGGQDLL